MDVALSRRRLRRALALASAAVTLAGAAAQVALALAPPADDPPPHLTFFALGYEVNLPSWYSALLLALCALLLALCAAAAPVDRPRWRLLALGFLYISLDELVGLHEAVDALFTGTRGLLYYGWVIPAGALVLALAALYRPFLARLPPPPRRRVLLAAALYLSGALLLELPLGLVAERAGPEGLAYALLDLTEETLEIAGLTLFALALLDHLTGDDGHLRLRLAP